jgi:hypothetical protein
MTPPNWRRRQFGGEWRMATMQIDPQKTFTALGDKAIVFLTTFRKNGERIASPV